MPSRAITADPHHTLLAFDAFNTLFTYDPAPHGGALHQLFTAANIQGASDRFVWNTYALTRSDTIQNLRTHLANIPTYKRISNDQRKDIEADHLAELDSVRFHHNEIPDALRSISDDGYKTMTIISNIGQAFGVAVSNLLYKNSLHRIIDPEKASYSYRVGYIKGNKKIFEHTAHTHKVELADILMVGNHLAKDVHSARAAGCQAIQIIRDGNKERADKAGPIIHSISELRSLLLAQHK